MFYFIGNSFGQFDDLYFVIVTLTTVGYGDVTPKTYNEKVLTIILILIGIFVFSTITAAMSSFLTDKILEDDEEDIKEEIEEVLNQKTELIMEELKNTRKENQRLQKEVNELKELIKDK